MKAMFPLSETCFHYQKKLSANQVIRLRCPENFWRGIVVSLRRIGLTSCLMRQACSPKIHHKELSPILFRLDGMVAARMRGAVTHSLPRNGAAMQRRLKMIDLRHLDPSDYKIAGLAMVFGWGAKKLVAIWLAFP
jgi:hypothetical protein